MKIIKQSLKLIWFCVTLVCSNQIIAQNPVLDSLNNELQNHPERDTARVKLLNKIAYHLIRSGSDSVIIYIDEAESLSEEIGYEKGIGASFYIKGTLEYYRSNNNKAVTYLNIALKIFKEVKHHFGISQTYSVIGSVYTNIGDYQMAIENYEQALLINKKNDNKKEISAGLNNIAKVYALQGDFANALVYFNQALKIAEEIDDKNDKNHIVASCANIASIYKIQGNYPLALEYYNRAMTVNESSRNSNPNYTASCLSNMAGIYLGLDDNAEALVYFKKALKLFRSQKSKSGEITSLVGIGNAYRQLDKLDLSRKYYLEALDISRSINDKDKIINCLINLGEENLQSGKYNQGLNSFNKALELSIEIDSKRGCCQSYLGISNYYLKKNKYDNAILNAIESNKIAKEINFKLELKESYKVLSDAYYKTKNYKKAYENQIIFKTLSDSIFNKENIQKITALEYEYAYQARLDSAKHTELELTNEVAQADIYYEKSQRQILYGVIGFLALIILLVTVISILRIRNVKSKSEQVLVEQKLLRSQMTPHFIFNSISVLQGIVSNKEYEKSEVYMSKFSKLLRRVLENSKDRTVKLTDELQVIENYLSIQNLGVENLYNYKISVDDNVNIEDVLVPPMIIQPFVENAIEHGFKNKGNDRKIEIKLKFEGEDLICAIEDNGVGINFYASNQSTDRQSMSTAITAKRLKMLAKEYKVNTDVKIEDRSVFNEVGTLVTLMLPYKMS